ncbi:hypothetical protein FXN63_04970 [Pigmentiphaga aceris]|uniref:TolC family protein n=1 Tax=Pigmentiphaga aceris TaxID=1940612 RepID=A0A5C0ASL1_9BURK|nr:hypothetical protein [Pigmentiphaga aceris]QEI05259.1 hypothetical protein FXN63_04970 [Pigmentiphaga aceris]
MLTSFCTVSRVSLAIGLLAAPLGVWAQASSPADGSGWRDANATVGQFKRGHADVLKWEQREAQMAAEPAPASAPVGLPLTRAEDAVRLAWQVHRELAQVLAQVGIKNVDLLARGHWDDIDPFLFRRIGGLDEVVEVAVQARKAWIDAVFAQARLKPVRAALDAASAANTLGQRMRSVGNWSALQQADVQLAAVAASMALQRDRYAATQAQVRLIDVLQLSGMYASVQLPDRLPELPAKALSDADIAERARAMQDRLPRANRLRNERDVALRSLAYQTSHALARKARDEVLAQREFITEETVLQYNGMLKSTWDLLDASRAQSLAAASALQAQHDFEIARVDLQWVLLGGEPASPISLGGDGGDTSAVAGH